jgi:hypothetical protein
MNYLKGNVMGRPPEGQWFNRKQGDEGIYAKPKYNWEMGEVDGFHGGGKFSKFSDDFMKTGTGGHVFGHGHYISEEKGVGKYYYDLYQKEHGAPEMFKTSVRGKTDWLDKQPEWLRNEVADLYRNDVPVSAWGDFLRRRKESFSRSIRTNEERLKTSIQPWIEEANIVNAKKSLKPMDDLISDLDKGLVEKAVETKAAGIYKVKLFKGKDPSEYNFMDWDKPVSKSNAEKISKIADELPTVKSEYGHGSSPEQLREWLKPHMQMTGEDIYRQLSDGLGSQKAASEFLQRAGIDGNRYPVGTLSGQTSGSKLLIDGQELFKRISKDRTPKSHELVMESAASVGSENKSKIVSHLKTVLKDNQEQLTSTSWGTLGESSRFFYQNNIEAINTAIGRIEAAKTIKFSPGPKNFVIFDPKNIEIMEGPGKNALLNPGYPKGEF